MTIYELYVNGRYVAYDGFFRDIEAFNTVCDRLSLLCDLKVQIGEVKIDA